MDHCANARANRADGDAGGGARGMSRQLEKEKKWRDKEKHLQYKLTTQTDSTCVHKNPITLQKSESLQNFAVTHFNYLYSHRKQVRLYAVNILPVVSHFKLCMRVTSRRKSTLAFSP